LLYTSQDDAFVIVASKAGDPHHPAWYDNLLAHSESVTIEVDGAETAVHPRVATGAEHEALWPLVNDNDNDYETYQSRAGERLIPIIILKPKRAPMGDDQ
jgi:deazaflavin-dependent oxidoreductase (nitroreductase family)